MSIIARIYIVRHGETEENRMGIMQGQLDTQLNEAGIEQAERAAEALERVKFGAAYSSDLERAAKTAEIILAKHPGVALVRYEELRERYLGDIQGMKMDEKMIVIPNAETPPAFSARAIRWWNKFIIQRHIQVLASKPQVQAQKSEAVLVPRTEASGSGANPSNLSPSAPSPETSTAANILVVSHGGVIGTLVQSLLGSRKLRCAKGVVVGRCLNASISVIEVGENRKGVLVSYGNTGHLHGELVDVNVDELGSGAGRGR